MLVDNHRVYRTGIRTLIETAKLSRVFESPHLGDADFGDRVDLLLIDTGSLDERSYDVLHDARARDPGMRLALMSASNARSEVLRCLSAGFHGFVHKTQPDEEWLVAISDLLSGRIYVPQWIAGHDYESETPPTSSEPEPLRLSRRQSEILPFLAQGLSNKEIARELNIAVQTTKIHIAALLRALGARNRTEAAFMAAKVLHKPPLAGAVPSQAHCTY